MPHMGPTSRCVRWRVELPLLFETCSGTLKTSVRWRRPDEAGRRSEQRDCPSYRTIEGSADFHSTPFAEQIQDPDINHAFSEKLKTFQEQRPPDDILHSISLGHGWSPTDTKFLASLSVDDYYNMFKLLESPRLRRVVEAALGFWCHPSAGSIIRCNRGQREGSSSQDWPRVSFERASTPQVSHHRAGLGP
jgi:hypothetical protein